MQKMRIIGISANRFGYEVLKEMCKFPGAEIVAVITLKKDSRTVMYDGMEPEAWHCHFERFNIKVHEVDDINVERDFIRGLAPDLVIACGWRQIIGADLLGIPKHGWVGFHPTLLPVGRGPAPIINTLLCGFTSSGMTMFHLSPGLDDGDIIDQECFAIEENDHATELHEKAIAAGITLVQRLFNTSRVESTSIVERLNRRIPQDPANVIMFERRTLADNEIMATDSPEIMFRKIKAFAKPYKGAFIMMPGGGKLMLWRAEKS